MVFQLEERTTKFWGEREYKLKRERDKYGEICSQERNRRHQSDIVYPRCHDVVHHLHDEDVIVHHGTRLRATR